MTRIEITEREIQKSILDFLAFKKIFAWRNNSGVIFQTDRNGKSYAHRMGPKGSSDIIGVLNDGRFLAIEVKKPGKEPTPEQVDFINKIRHAGGVAFVAKSIDDVQSNLF